MVLYTNGHIAKSRMIMNLIWYQIEAECVPCNDMRNSLYPKCHFIPCFVGVHHKYTSTTGFFNLNPMRAAQLPAEWLDGLRGAKLRELFRFSEELFIIKLHRISSHSGLFEWKYRNILYFRFIISLVQQICMKYLISRAAQNCLAGHMRSTGWKVLL